MTSRFAELQDAFQRAILEDDPGVLDALLDGAAESRSVLLRVYSDGYVLRLVGVLRNDCPVLSQYLGDEDFAEVARAYIAAHPSRTSNLRWFARDLPAFLRNVAPYSDHIELTDMAGLELALSDAFDTRDAPVAGMAALGQAPAERWADLVFVPHPSARELVCASNLTEIWSFVTEDRAPPPARRLERPERLLVWRNDATAMFRPLGDEEAMLWSEAGRGVAFRTLCEMAATYDDPATAPARVAGYLQGWLQSDLLTAVELPPG